MDRVKELDRKGDFDKLDGAARAAEKYNPLDGEAVAYEAKAKLALGKLEESEQLFLESLDKNPKDDKTWRMLARLYIQRKDVEKAVNAAKTSRSINPLESQDTGPVEEQLRAIGAVLGYQYVPGGIDIHAVPDQ